MSHPPTNQTCQLHLPPIKIRLHGRFVKLMTWQNLLRWLQLINLHVHSLAVDRNYNFSPHQESQTLAGGD